MKLELNKSLISTWILVFFALTLSMAAFISDLFQAPNNKGPQISRYQTLFDSQQMSSIRGLGLKNNLGDFFLEKKDQNSSWSLLSPRNMPADESKVDAIVQILRKIKIRKVLTKDKINIQNFSLDDPLLELTLVDSSGLRSSLSLGLVNPIDNSTYAMLSTHEAIYQIDALELNLSNLDYSNFVDSRIFSFDPNKMSSFKVYRGKKEANNIVLSLTKKDGSWIGKNNHELEAEKVIHYLSKLTQLRSLFIIDKASEKQEEQLNNYLSRPLYTIECEDDNKEYYRYIVSSFINSIKGLKLEKWQNFVITASNRDHPYILKRALLKNFKQKERPLRRLPFKKLFY